jgi:asparagine synthase (glutamine-hydrolysing)
MDQARSGTNGRMDKGYSLSMCGICGILRFEKGAEVDPVVIHRMSETISHRGPDEGGIHAEGQIGLGHRRLSIIDIAGGHQPMKSQANGVSLVIVYNGEIYNYVALRLELKGLGHTFRTASDTEVLLASYGEWGNDCVNHLRGMFAFAIWDETKKSLFLARDRMGIKPLYYYQDDEFVIFASEIKAIFASGMVASSIEYSALDSFLTLGYVPGPMTMFKGISKLLPGHNITIDENGRKETECYWNFDKITLNPISFSGAQENLDKLLTDSVGMRLMSEVPLGVFLSGGLDSSAITALMSRITDQRIKTFTLGYEGADEANELGFARKVATLFGTEHHEITLEPYDFIDSIPELVKITEEPLAQSTAISLHQIAKEAKRYATVLLSGEGSDEVFAGYGLYAKMLTMDRANGLSKFFGMIPDACLPGDKLKKYADWFSSAVEDRYRSSSGYLTERIKRHFYSPELLIYNKQNNFLEETFFRWFKDVEGRSPLSRLLYVDSKTWLLEDLLLRADKMTMATSVELRVPFLDHKIVEFASSLPDQYKINNGETKFILKKLMEKYLPKEIIYRKKMGFSVPTKRWFAGDLLGPAKDIIFSRKLLDTGWFQKKYLESMFDRHSNKKEDYSIRIFSLLVLYHWLDIYS